MLFSAIPETPPSSKSSKAPLIAFLLLVAVAALVAILVMKSRGPAVTQAPKPAPPLPAPAVTQAPTPAPPPASPPVTAAPTTKPPEPQVNPNKAAVEAYLAQVAVIEKQRQTTVNNMWPAYVAYLMLKGGGSYAAQLEELMAVDPQEEAAARKKVQQADPTAQARKVIEGYSTQMVNLAAQFRRIPVPPVANNFAASYNQVFTSYLQVFNQVMVSLQTQDITNLNPGAMQSQKDQPMMNANMQMDALCRSVGLTKPFEITDSPAGGVAGM